MFGIGEHSYLSSQRGASPGEDIDAPRADLESIPPLTPVRAHTTRPMSRVMVIATLHGNEPVEQSFRISRHSSATVARVIAVPDLLVVTSP